jgi:oxygen-independent coproporphyrinogen-3 oxidase
VYWRNGEWLGVGAGSHSHLAGKRSHRSASLTGYLAAIEGREPRLPDPAADDAVDTAILALRLDEGLDVRSYALRFGERHATRVRRALDDATRLGLVRVTGGRARLSARGRLLASEVFVRLIPDDDVATSRHISVDLVAAS